MEQRIHTLHQLLPDIIPRMAQVQPSLLAVAGIIFPWCWVNQQVPFCIRSIEGKVQSCMVAP